MGYALNGDFVECCDCFTVCPCWVSDLPDEDHCSGLYLWSFAEGSQIDGVSVSGMRVAAATFHAVRAGGQAMFFIDAGLAGHGTEQLLFRIFSGGLGGPDLEGLVKLMGVNLGYQPAKIAAAFSQDAFDVTISVNGQSIATAEGTDKKFENQASPMTLKDTALSEKLGIGAGLVVVQKMESLTVNVAALPGGPLNFRGRSGMRSKFTYAYHGPRPIEETDEEQAQGAGAEG